jgi:Right handed beta helix region
VPLGLCNDSLKGWQLLVHRLAKLVLATAFCALAIPASASAQATRTWVSGVGDDANPCSRTAPCKTFAGAISKTAAGGEINIIDPGGFGGVTITKSITIRGRGGTAGALVSGTNAFVINAAATDKVTIDGIDINGIGTGAQTSLTGIKVLSAARVNILNNEIYRFRAGVAVVPTSAETRVVLRNNQIHDNAIGAINAPGNNLITSTIMTLRNNTISDNFCGVVTSGFGANASTPVAATACGAASAGAIDKRATARLFHNGIHDNSFGVFGRGANSITDLAHNEITGNSTFGLRRVDGAEMRTTTPPTNVLSGNVADDLPNGALTTARVRRGR